VGPVTFVHGALARPGGRAGGKGGAATMQPGQGGWPLAGSYMHGLNVSVAWKKKAACVGGAGAWKLATTACASLGLGPWRFAAGTMVRRRGGVPHDCPPPPTHTAPVWPADRARLHVRVWACKRATQGLAPPFSWSARQEGGARASSQDRTHQRASCYHQSQRPQTCLARPACYHGTPSRRGACVARQRPRLGVAAKGVRVAPARDKVGDVVLHGRLGEHLQARGLRDNAAAHGGPRDALHHLPKVLRAARARVPVLHARLRR